uniref:Nuclear receptor subfamily 1 group I member 3 n=1 Tax=Phascolarctos cinereus TaxID=38626 RepID=A0A6P5J2X5_PHACI|nr:nuclear receptor subfamily 1 group I member 3 isoform X2 [Phascolarctos cinereus]
MASKEDGLRSCAVCGDRATGYHFHALTCEGCKGFFRRTVKKGMGLTCPFEQCCEVSKNQRRHCPACRLQKCFDAGMRKDMILSAEVLAQRRAKQAQKRAEQEPVQLNQKQKALVQLLLGAHARHVGTIFDQFVQFRPPAHLFTRHQPTPPLPPALPLLIHLADISTFMVQQVIKFTKDLPHFRSLPMEDQISLLKGAAPEICHIELNTTFCPHSHTFLCGPLRYTLQDIAHVGFQEQFLAAMFRFHVTLRRLQLQEPEYALMAALALFSPDARGDGADTAELHQGPASPAQRPPSPDAEFREPPAPVNTYTMETRGVKPRQAAKPMYSGPAGWFSLEYRPGFHFHSCSVEKTQGPRAKPSSL